ncbi:MAG: hypothetical protein AAF656_06365 [Planctomycetota bacterium]
MADETAHSLYDWQVSTLMLAYDVADPLDRDDKEQLAQREETVRAELLAIAKAVVPAEFWEDGGKELTPEVAHGLTKAVIGRAATIAGCV